MVVPKSGICRRCGGTDIAPSGNCRPCRKEDVKKWKAANREKVNANNREYAARVRREALEVLGLRCSCPGCTVDRYVFLSIDHINGGGQQERKAGSNPHSRYKWIARNPEEARAKFQTLCFNCNQAKHFERGGHTCLDL